MRAARKFGPCARCDLTTSEFNYATQSEINIIDKPQGQRQKQQGKAKEQSKKKKKKKENTKRSNSKRRRRRYKKRERQGGNVNDSAPELPRC